MNIRLEENEIIVNKVLISFGSYVMIFTEDTFAIQ